MSSCKTSRRLLCRVLLVCLAAFVPACGRRQANNENLQKQWNAKCKEAADLLAGVTDVGSAKVAQPNLKAVLQEIDKINNQLEKSYDPENVSPNEARGMVKELANGVSEMQRLNDETLRISKKAELVAALGDVWKMLPMALMLDASGGMPKS